ncbi:MAG: TrkA family potassium uptake protein [Nocardioidaceae bacterium]
MGCGRVGSTLARELERRDHSVAVIDSNPDAFRRLGPGFRGDQVTGYGFDPAVLTKAGIEHADGFAAVSSGDNSNIISARVARESFGIDNVVARIYDPGRAEVYERLGIPTVATVRWTSHQIVRRLLPHGAEPQWRDPSGAIRIDDMLAPAQWVGRHLTELETTGARVVYLSRLGEGLMVTPERILQDGDVVSLVMAESQADDVEAALAAGPEEH